MMKIAYFSLMVALASSQQCNYYKPSSILNYHYPVGRCLQASSYSPSSSSDVMITCGNGNITRSNYAANSGCTGTPTSTQVITTASQFRCGGTNCYIQYEYSSTSFSDTGISSTNCTSKDPPVLIDAVPGLCADTRDTFYCGTNGVYIATTCSVTNSTATPFIPIGVCSAYSSLSPYKFLACTGGPAVPGGNYLSANSYADCNFFNVNGTRGPIDVCQDILFVSQKAKCTDANTLEVGSWLGIGCPGSPLSVQTYKKGDPMVDFLCTGSQCIVEHSSYSSATDCTGSVSKTSYAAGKCTGSNMYYCYGTNNNKIFEERYLSSSSFVGCQKGDLSTSGTIYDTGVCIPSSFSTRSDMWSCSLTGTTPPFGSLSAGHMVSLEVAAWVAALVAVFSI